MMKINASVDLECEAKSVDECQAGMSLFTLYDNVRSLRAVK